MNELTDLEICKRLAEIEGYKKTGTVWGECVIVSNEDDTTSFNPITDDALCFRLMVKHSVRVEPENCSAWTDNDDGYPQYEVIHCKWTINKAICLAIIKSKE
jgi:hypothetical protein